MIKNYIKIAWRNIIRRKGYSAINIAGLSVGIAACLLIFVVIKYELSFDTFQPNFKNIYRVVTTGESSPDGMAYNPGISGAGGYSVYGLDFPQATVAALNSSYGSQLTVPSVIVAMPLNDKKSLLKQRAWFLSSRNFLMFLNGIGWLAMHRY